MLTMVGVCLACVPPQEPSFIVNETSAPLQVGYGAPFSYALGTPSCTLLNDPPAMWANEDDLRSRRDWSNPPSLEMDFEKCEASFLLEPRAVARVYTSGFCSDYERHLDPGDELRPSLEYLVIESRGGTREWRRWEAVAQFERAWWSGWCYLRVRE